MEAVPRLPMLWVALRKSPEGTSFVKLKKFIGEIYQEDPEAYSKEVFAFETLRNVAMRPEKSTDGINILKRYYCQLHSLTHRFPKPVKSLFTFTWTDKYSNTTMEYNDINYEMASVLFNIGALHTQVGSGVKRTDVDGMKLACTHFQCAAWCFTELKERYGNLINYEEFMSEELLIFMQQISFAQAQECILEKSLIDNRKPIIVAKVTSQIISYYNTGMSALIAAKDKVKSNTGLSKLIFFTEGKDFKIWRSYVSFKVSYLTCVMFLYQGYQAEERQSMGERLTYYQASYDKLQEATKDLKGIFDIDRFKESITFTHDVVEGKRDNAKKENEFIYHQEVPQLNTLSSIQGANLVNGIGFEVTDPDVSGEDIFGRLVPMEAHEGSSLYSEEKAQLLRTIGAKVEQKNVELTTYMSSLNLENLNISEERANKIPQGIVDRCAALNANTEAIPDLISSMSNLADICAEVETSLNEIQNILNDEETKENQYKQSSGEHHRTNTHLTELSKEFQKYKEAHNKACESNDTLRKAMELHVNNLKILSSPLQEIQSHVPKLSSPIEESMFKDLKLILNKANEMRAQREQFHADLRIAINDDDITAKVIANNDLNLNELFKKEISKHDLKVNLIEQNLSAQHNILAALTEEYAKTAPLLKTLSDIKHQKENFYSSLAASYDVYEDLLAKSGKGLEFYKKLQSNIQKLFTRIRAARDVQNEDRELRLKATQNIPQLPTTIASSTSSATSVSSNKPKLRDYLNSQSKLSSTLPTVRPSPLGSESPSTDGNYHNNKSAYPVPNDPPPPYTPNIQNQYYNNNSYANPTNQQSVETVDLNAVKSSRSAPSPYNIGYQYQTQHFSQQNSSNFPQNQQTDVAASFQIQPQQQLQTFPNQPYYQAASTSSYQQQLQPVTTQAFSQIPVSYNSSQNATFQLNNQGFGTGSYQQPIQDKSTDIHSLPNQSLNYQSPYSVKSDLQDQFAGMQIQPQTCYQQTPVSTMTASNTSSQLTQANSTYNISSNAQATSSYMQQTYTYNQQPVNSSQQSQVNMYPAGTNYYVQPGASYYQQPISGTSVITTLQDKSPYDSQNQAYNPQIQQQQQSQPPGPGPMQQPQMQNQQDTYQQASSQQNQSYQYSHPGYVYNGSTGNYEYTSGYQSQNYNPYYSQVGFNNSSEYKSINSNSQDESLKEKQEQPQNQQSSNTLSYYSIQYGQQPQNQQVNISYPSQVEPRSNMTYMQSGKDSQNVQTTQSEPKSVQQIKKVEEKKPEKSSVLDLLADIDFSEGQAPLQPALIATKIETTRRVSLPSSDSLEGENDTINSSIPIKTAQPPAQTIDRKQSTDNLSICSEVSSIAIDLDSISIESDTRKEQQKSFDDPKVRNNFVKEVERYEKVIETLNVKMLNGKTPLMNKWNELNETLAKTEEQRSTSIAKLFPEKNYSNDCVPFNSCLVRLEKETDNYINAAFIKNLALGDIPSMFILGQTPLTNTVNDFWSMIWTRKARVTVCLHTPKEILDKYWPTEINKEHSYDDFLVTLYKINDHSNCVEFKLKITCNGSDAILNISLLQIKLWSNCIPSQCIGVAKNIIDSYRENYDINGAHFPIVLTCLSGSERSGIAAVAICTILATQLSRPMLIDVIDVWNKICSARKNVIKDISVLEFTMNIVLTYAHELINKYGVMTSYQMKNAQTLQKENEDVKDPLNDLDPLWKLK